MTVSITDTGAVYTEFLDTVAPPNVDTATYYGLFGVSDAVTKKNLAPGGVDGVIVNTPAYTAGFATFGAFSRGIDTGLVGGNPFTHIMVAGRPAAGSSSGIGLMGHYLHGTTSERMDMLIDQYAATNNYGLFIENFQGQKYLAGVTPAIINMNFVYAQYDGTTMKVGHILTDTNGQVQHYSASGAYTDPTPAGTRSLRIGAMNYGSADVAFNASAAMEFASILTTDQLLAQYAWLRKFLGARTGGAAVIVN